MKLLVTGGAGFIGSNFIRYMIDRYPDYTIVNYDKLTYAGNLENLASVEQCAVTILLKAISVISSLFTIR